MSKSSLLVIFGLTIVIIISLAGYGFITKKQKIANKVNPFLQIEKGAFTFFNSTLKPAYKPAGKLHFAIRRIFFDDTTMFRSITWKKNDAQIYLQAFYTIEGERYNSSYEPLDYNLNVKKTLSKTAQLADLVRELNEIYVNPKLDSASKREFTYNMEKRDINIYATLPSGQGNLNTLEHETISANSKIIEYAWKHKNEVVETRSIWKIAQDEKGDIYQFGACLIYPIQVDFYKNRTCFARE